MNKLKVSSQIEVNESQAEVFSFHANLNNLTKVIPKFLIVKIDRIDLPLRAGSCGLFSVWLFDLIFLFNWSFKITDYNELNYFTDTAQGGLFQYFSHTHQFIKITENTTLLKDEIEFCFSEKWTFINKIIALFIKLALKLKLNTSKKVIENRL